MAFIIFTLLLSLTVFSSSRQSEFWRDFRDLEKHEFTRLNILSSYCTKPGLQCANCKTSIICMMEEGNYTAVLLEECEGGNTCDEGVCTATPNTVCAGAIFECGVVEGMYPDPVSCETYHYCVPKQPTTATSPSSIDSELFKVDSKCKDNYGYNALTTYCDKKLPVNGSCPLSSIPKCVKDGQTGALIENPTIFYTCRPVPRSRAKTLYPYLDACTHGKKYEASTYTCK